MRDLAEPILAWLAEGHRVALAFVVDTSGSAPRGKGSTMAVRDDGLIVGSVSGGCVEGAVVAAARRALVSGRGELLEFGGESEAALFEVGLSCGGTIQVWVAPADATVTSAYLESVQRREPVGIEFSLDPDRPTMARLSDRPSDLGLSGSHFRLWSPPAFRLVIVGAVHIAVALVGIARTMGWETVVIDPRTAFADPERFPAPPGQLRAEWPDSALDSLGLDGSTGVVCLTHDPKVDDRALAAALRSPARYVGALGGSKTQAKRRATLLEMGLTEAEISRLHGPVGLDIGARSPEEIALSIVAEIVRVQNATT